MLRATRAVGSTHRSQGLSAKGDVKFSVWPRKGHEVVSGDSLSISWSLSNPWHHVLVILDS